jgi:predicted membrane-bound spermidine synthase
VTSLHLPGWNWCLVPHISFFSIWPLKSEALAQGQALPLGKALLTAAALVQGFLLEITKAAGCRRQIVTTRTATGFVLVNGLLVLLHTVQQPSLLLKFCKCCCALCPCARLLLSCPCSRLVFLAIFHATLSCWLGSWLSSQP